jgi:cytochrome c oxidase cbb3-type subunit III
MTRNMEWIGFLGTLLIVAVLGITAMREPNQQARAEQRILEEAVERGIELYAVNCVMCHGAKGEGLAAIPALANDGVMSMDAETLFRVIERGRYNTIMAGYGVAEGGVLQNSEIDGLTALIQNPDWFRVETRVAELGLTPPEVVIVEIDDNTLAKMRDLPNGDVLADGLMTYSENCAACHGGNGEGTALAPGFDSADLSSRYTTADLIRIVEEGVPTTLMAAWKFALTDDEINNVTALTQSWDDVRAAGVAVPVVEVKPIEMSPEAVAAGGQLFNILCASCHGANGYGTPMAPALNNQTFLDQTPDEAIRQIVSMGVSGTVMPAWGGRLTETDINNLLVLMRSWQPTAPVYAP